ncbi:MAG: hypothetical protein M3O50_01900 [Myxococcota bacterium]|nr:hypothetical protein [Myxococcota bacterium]
MRFGFREIEQRRADAQHTRYYLNGIRVDFRGDRGTDGEDFVGGHDFMVNHARAVVPRDRKITRRSFAGPVQRGEPVVDGLGSVRD